MSRATVCVDFDGTIHPYTDGWVGTLPSDEPPLEATRHFLADLHATYRVVVLSARAGFPAGADGIARWLDDHRLTEHVDEITAVKPAAVAYVDDRSVVYAGDWRKVLDEVDWLAQRRNGAGKPWAAER